MKHLNFFFEDNKPVAIVITHRKTGWGRTADAKMNKAKLFWNKHIGCIVDAEDVGKLLEQFQGCPVID